MNMYTKVKPGLCPYCLGNIGIITTDITSITIDADGSPILADNTATFATGICEKCGAKFDYEQKLMSWYPKGFAPQKREVPQTKPRVNIFGKMDSDGVITIIG